MIVEYSASFDRLFAKLPDPVQEASRQAVREFLQRFTGGAFPKGLRVHKCGPFVSISVDMSYRIFLHPTLGGIRFVFIGNHRDADRYLKDQSG